MEFVMKNVLSAAMVSLSLAAAGLAPVAANADSLTRAQVVEQLQQARAQGLLSEGQSGYPVQKPADSHVSRTAVLADLAMARANGQLNVSEAQPYPAETSASSNVSRSVVLAQLSQFEAQHPDQVIEH
jgi:opacity protein-like surface antigen